MASDADWPATRKAIDKAISRARREIKLVTGNSLDCLGEVGRRAAEDILARVRDSLDDIDQTIPPAEDDDE